MRTRIHEQFRIRAVRCCIGAAVLAFNVGAQEHFRADDHAPIGVMGDHYHEVGELMLSYRYMSMPMGENLMGTDTVDAEEIVTSIPNRFFGNPGQPPTLRIVPTRMDMQMHMVGVMYASSDRVTLMAMLNYVNKSMEHRTFRGGMGTNVLGEFNTETGGLADSSLSALIRLYEDDVQRLHATLGLSFPTGAVDETGTVLAPTGVMPTLRLPYPMQLGSGANDLLGGLTYSRFFDSWSWGAQWRGAIRNGSNDEGYALGDEHRLTAWFGRPISPQVSWSVRAEYYRRGNIEGRDPRIMGPVQTADPARLEASRLDLALGINFGTEAGHRVALEYLIPATQDLGGPQLGVDQQLILGLQYTF